MSIQPLGHRVLIKAKEAEEVLAGGIIIPDTAKEKPQHAEVISLGSGGKDKNGEDFVFDVKEGDIVLTSKYGGTVIKDGDEEFTIINHSDILALVK